MRYLSSSLRRLIILLTFAPFGAFSQSVPSPKDFLGYEIGEAFTYHHKMVAYFEKVAAASPKVKLIPYGETPERRPLFLAVVSSEANMKRLETIRINNLKLAGMMEGEPVGDTPPIVWFSYNIHGNESVSLETAMLTLHYLVSSDTAGWLNQCVVVLDPCLNPDGRDRYTNWYNQAVTRPYNARRDAREHREPWPGGRYNHYLFDLNRDWCWQTQPESRARAVVYRQWYPHVMVDFHEMGPQSPYFFGPSAKPFHAVVTGWQRKFQEIVGENNARYFDREGWLYFTREVYDLLYPSYGDTWTTFNGSVGFTYEQGGSGVAGLGLLTESGDTLTLKDRVAHHYTSGLSTIEASVKNGQKLVSEFKTYFQNARDGKVTSDYKAFVLRPGDDPDALPDLLRFLSLQGIEYYVPATVPKSALGFNYFSQKNDLLVFQQGDVVVPVKQTHGHMAVALLEPKTFLEDSLTYDLTGWALPYAYDLQAWAMKDALPIGSRLAPPQKQVDTQPGFAYAFDWRGPSDLKLLADALNRGLRPRQADQPITLTDKELSRGSLIFSRTDNPFPDFDEQVQELAAAHGQNFVSLPSGMLPGNKDLGSESFKLMKKAKVALVGGQGVTATAYGEMWHFLENTLEYPVTLLQKDYLSSVWLNAYDVVILPDGNYDRLQEQLLGYVKAGGRLIALEGAVDFLAELKKEDTYLTKLGKATADAKAAREKADQENREEITFGDQERFQLTGESAGSVVEIALDPSHPVAYGQDESVFLLKKRNSVYPLLPEGCWNVGVFAENPPVSGFMGASLRKQVGGSLAMGVEPMGKGEIIYFAEAPFTRAFWYVGQLFLGNALFMDM
jgi:hypothetical protein